MTVNQIVDLITQLFWAGLVPIVLYAIRQELQKRDATAGTSAERERVESHLALLRLTESIAGQAIRTVEERGDMLGIEKHATVTAVIGEALGQRGLELDPVLVNNIIKGMVRDMNAPRREQEAAAKPAAKSPLMEAMSEILETADKGDFEKLHAMIDSASNKIRIKE